jgi:hypothetical protein
MKNKIAKIGFSAALFFSMAGIFSVDTVKANTSENASESNFSQAGKVCKVTKRGGANIYVASLDKYFRIRRGGTMIVVDPEPHQGIIVVRAMLNRKMTQGEIKLDDTNCVPILPR